MDLFVAFVMVFTVAGSYSFGYLFLRSGWPKIRKLEEGYKIGWSIILGSVFSIIAIAVASVIDVLKLSELSSLEVLSIVLAITLAIILAFLSVRRRFFAGKRMEVSVPKEAVSADITAGKLVSKIASDKGFIITKELSEEKIRKIKEALKKSLEQAKAKEEAKKPVEKQVVVEKGREENEKPKPVTIEENKEEAKTVLEEKESNESNGV